MPLEDKTTMYVHCISHAITLSYDAIDWKETRELSKIKQCLIKELQEIVDEPEAKEYIEIIQNNSWQTREDLDLIKNSLNI